LIADYEINKILVAWFHFENQLGLNVFFYLFIYLFLFKIVKNHRGHAMYDYIVFVYNSLLILFLFKHAAYVLPYVQRK
jgi:hypothetical protein